MMLLNLQENDEIIDTILNGDDSYSLVFNESTSTYAVRQTTAQATNTLKSFLKTHPFLNGYAVRFGLDALSAYNKNKNLTARFYAKTPYERVLYKDMVKKLVSSGDYSLAKSKYINGGIMYELVKEN